MQLPIQLDGTSSLSLQTQLFEGIRAMILGGHLCSAERLPPTRLLSQQLGVSRITVSLAYDRLADEGYIETIKSVGTFVSREIPEQALHVLQSETAAHAASAADVRILKPANIGRLRSQALVNQQSRRLSVDFCSGRPDPNSFPVTTWSRLINRRLLGAGAALTEYRDPAGLMELRQAIADHLRPARGVITNPEQIFIVGGSQDALNLVCRLLVRSGTPAVVEGPGYAGAAYLFESFDADMRVVPVDEKGMDVAQLGNWRNAIAYVTPSHQYPMGVTLSLDRRLKLLAWAIDTNSYLVEDDYDSDFRYHGSPIAALKGLDRGDRVFYVGTFSKCLGAGLRLGYVVVPAALVTAARHYKTLMNNGQPWLEQAALADFMISGKYGRHLRQIRQHYLSKRNALLAVLDRHFGSGCAIGTDAGMHFVWRIPENLPHAEQLQAMALEAGVGLYTLDAKSAVSYCTPESAGRYLMFGFASSQIKDMCSGIDRLAEVLRSSKSTPKMDISPYAFSDARPTSN